MKKGVIYNDFNVNDNQKYKNKPMKYNPTKDNNGDKVHNLNKNNLNAMIQKKDNDYNKSEKKKEIKKENETNINIIHEMKEGFNFDKNILSPINIENAIIQEGATNFPILTSFINKNNEEIVNSNNNINFNNSNNNNSNNSTIEPESCIILQKEDKSNIDQNVITNYNNNSNINDTIKEEREINTTNIGEKEINDVKEKETSKDSETLVNNKNENIFTFDNNIIEPCKIENKNFSEGSSMNKIYSDYSHYIYIQLNKLTKFIKSDAFLHKKIKCEKKKEHLHPDLVFDLYEKNIILPISNNSPLDRIKIKEENFDEIETINNIIEGNKNINIFKKKENEIICKKPPINIDENINDFQKMMNQKKTLFDAKFINDQTYVPKLRLNLEDKNHNNFDFYLPSPLHESYSKKTMKSININNPDDRTNKVNFPTGEEHKIENNTIYTLNIRNINKLKYTRAFNKAKIGNNDINITINMLSSFMDNINELYEQSNIRAFQVDNDAKCQKCNVDNKLDNIFTEIFYSFKNDNIYSSKSNFDEIFAEDSIEDIHTDYSNKYFAYVDLYDYSNKNDIDIFDDIDINIIHERFKIYKNKRIKQKEKYLCGGDASIELMKTTFTDNKYNNSQTLLLHSISNDLININNITKNEEIKNIANKSENLSKNGPMLRSTKKLMNELNRSLINRYTFNSKNDINNQSDSHILSLDKKIAKSGKLINKREKEKNRFENMMKKIKKTNDDINKKEKKMYNSKLKVEQEINFQKELKKERIFKLLYPFIFFVIPLSITLYNKFTQG